MESRLIFLLVFVLFMVFLGVIHYKNIDDGHPLYALLPVGYIVGVVAFCMVSCLTGFDTSYEKLRGHQVEVLKNDSRAIIIHTKPDGRNIERMMSSHKKYVNINDSSNIYLKKEYNFWGYPVREKLRASFEVEPEQLEK